MVDRKRLLKCVILLKILTIMIACSDVIVKRLPDLYYVHNIIIRSFPESILEEYWLTDFNEWSFTKIETSDMMLLT